MIKLVLAVEAALLLGFLYVWWQFHCCLPHSISLGG